MKFWQLLPATNNNKKSGHSRLEVAENDAHEYYSTNPVVVEKRFETKIWQSVLNEILLIDKQHTDGKQG